MPHMPEPEWLMNATLPPRPMRARLEAAGPDAVAKIVEAHAVGAADEQAVLADARRDALAQRGHAIVLEHERRHERRGAGAMRDGFVERRLDARIADREDHVLDALGSAASDGKQGTPQTDVRPGIHRVQRAGKSAVQQVLDDDATDGARALGRAEHRDRGGLEQWIEPMRHVASAPRRIRSRRPAWRDGAADRRTRLRPRGSAP